MATNIQSDCTYQLTQGHAKLRAVRVGWLWLVAIAVIQGCAATSGSLQGANSTLIPPQDVSHIVPQENTPRVERGAREENSAKPLPSVMPTRNVGEASWYGPGFRGKKTASGEIFDDQKLTAAHKTLPLGSKAKVTNLDNQKSVEVEINDRGPYVEGRIIDLSHAAARALDMVEQGTAKVQIEIVKENSMSGSEQGPIRR